MVDRAEQPTELAEFLPFRLAGKRALRDDRVQDIDLAGGNEMISLAGAALVCIHRSSNKGYSSVTLADLITAPQRSVSSLTILAMFSGVPPTAVRCSRA